MTSSTEFDEDFDIAWEKLDEVIELLEIIEKTRGTGLSIDLINSIEKLSSGKQDECIEFNDYYSSLCYSVYDYVSTDYYYNDKNFLIENWKEFLLIHQPKTEEEGKTLLAKRAYEANQILEILLSKSYNDKMCGKNNPNKNSLFIILIITTSTDLLKRNK